MRIILALTLSVFLVSCASMGNKSIPNEYLETNNMNDLFSKVEEKIAKYGADEVLVVFDIDNTILTMEHDLGSDYWFTWQSGMLFSKDKKDKQACKIHCVASDFGGMLRVQGQLFALAPMVLTEKTLPAKIKELQDKGVTVILLTSRGPEFRNSTELALNDNGYNLKASMVGEGYPGTYKPEDPELKKTRSVSYMNGVYMTAGQHKGIMLRALLNKTDEDFDAIVFADDHSKHTKTMTDTFKGKVDLTTFRYGRIDKQVAKFKKANKSKVTAQWKALKRQIQKSFK